MFFSVAVAAMDGKGCIRVSSDGSAREDDGAKRREAMDWRMFLRLLLLQLAVISPSAGDSVDDDVVSIAAEDVVVNFPVMRSVGVSIKSSSPTLNRASGIFLLRLIDAKTEEPSVRNEMLL